MHLFRNLRIVMIPGSFGTLMYSLSHHVISDDNEKMRMNSFQITATGSVSILFSKIRILNDINGFFRYKSSVLVITCINKCQLSHFQINNISHSQSVIYLYQNVNHIILHAIPAENDGEECMACEFVLQTRSL